MLETHPFPPYVPPGARFLLLGSFAAKEALPGTRYYDPDYHWYYATRTNQFWHILESVYGVPLSTLDQKQDLFTRLRMAITDIILQCERRFESSQDSALFNEVYNRAAIAQILEDNPIREIFLTSQKVRSNFKREFRGLISRHPTVRLTYLPSPSRRYTLPLEEKIARYRALLPPIR